MNVLIVWRIVEFFCRFRGAFYEFWPLESLSKLSSTTLCVFKLRSTWNEMWKSGKIREEMKDKTRTKRRREGRGRREWRRTIQRFEAEAEDREKAKRDCIQSRGKCRRTEEEVTYNLVWFFSNLSIRNHNRFVNLRLDYPGLCRIFRLIISPFHSQMYHQSCWLCTMRTFW